MEFYYFIIFGLGGFWVYWSIKNEGILWIPRVIVNIGGFALWGYLTFTQYGKIDNKFFQLIAIAGTMIVFVLVALPINEILDKEKNLYDYGKKKIQNQIYYPGFFIVGGIKK